MSSRHTKQCRGVEKHRSQTIRYFNVLASSLTIARILEYGTGSVASRHFWNSMTYLRNVIFVFQRTSNVSAALMPTFAKRESTKKNCDYDGCCGRGVAEGKVRYYWKPSDCRITIVTRRRGCFVRVGTNGKTFATTCRM